MQVLCIVMTPDARAYTYTFVRALSARTSSTACRRPLPERLSFSLLTSHFSLQAAFFSSLFSG
jgi:hypothetical protein